MTARLADSATRGRPKPRTRTEPNAAPRPRRAIPGAWRQLGALLRKDVLLEVRTREATTPMVVFGLLVLVLFSFTFDLTAARLSPSLASGLVWTALLLASVLGVGRAFAAEREHGSLDGVLLAPVPGALLFVAKLLSTLLLMGASEVVLVPVSSVFFNLPLGSVRFLGSLGLGTLGLATTGTLFGAMAAGSRSREVLLPVIWLPVVVPLVIAVVQATAESMAGPSLLPTPPWLRLAAAFDGVFLAVSLAVFSEVVKE